MASTPAGRDVIYRFIRAKDGAMCHRHAQLITNSDNTTQDYADLIYTALPGDGVGGVTEILAQKVPHVVDFPASGPQAFGPAGWLTLSSLPYSTS